MQPNYEQIMREIRQGKYSKLGEGSGRKVYDMGNGCVIKYAKNHKGYAQNKQEYDIFHKRQDVILAVVFAMSSDGRILIMEKAQPCHSTSLLYQHYHVNRRKDFLSLPEIKMLMDDYYLLGVDLAKTSSWGEARGRIILIDYGYTSQVRRIHYNGLF